MTLRPRLILADLDGTLLRFGETQVTPEVAEMIKLLEASGVKVCVVTGRPFESAKAILQSVPIINPSIFYGGGSVIDPLTGTVLWQKTIPQQSALQALHILKEVALNIDYGLGHTDPKVMVVESITHDPIQIWARIPTDLTDQIVTKLRYISGLAIHVNFGVQDATKQVGLYINHHEADKFHATSSLLRLMNIKKGHTLAIADGGNDLPLFAAAQFKIAMGNAAENVKSAADYVVASVDNNGFCEAMKTFVLNSSLSHS